MPPIVETIGPPPYVAPAKPFAAGLSLNNAPEPTLAPLGHGRGLEAPRGIMVGVARPTAAPAGAGLPLPVQRAPLGRGQRAAAVDELAVAPESESEPAGMASPSAAPAPVAAAVEMAPPPRRLAVIGEAPRTAVRALTTAAPIDAPLRGYVGEARARRAPAVATPETPGIIQRAPAMQVPAPAAASAPAEAALAAAPRRLNVGQVRRSGLGAPIAGGPMTSIARLGAPPVQRASLVPPSAPATTAAAVAMPTRAPSAQAAPPAPEPAAVAAANMHTAMEPTASPSAVRPVAASTPVPVPVPAMVVSRAPRLEMPAVPVQALAPRVQRAPLTIPHGVQRSPRAGAPAAPDHRSGSKSGPFKVHRGGTADDLSASLDARSFTHDGEIYMPDSHGPLTSGVGRSLLAHELTHVVQQRQFGKALPAEGSSQGRRLEGQAVAAERSGTLPIDMPLATEAKPADAESTTDLAKVQRAANGAARAGDTTTLVNLSSGSGVQRAPADGGGTMAAPTTPTMDKAKPSEEELEDLAHQLYARIGRRLRRELLVDRERAGLVLDMP